MSTSVINQDSIQAPRLLVIDDDESVRKNIAGFLADSGFSVTEAASGEDGISEYSNHHPDLVLCDLRLPDLDGLDVMQRIVHSDNETPVIVISGLGEINDVVQALRLGAADYLTKPIKDLEVLEHSVRRSLQQAKLLRDNARYSAELEDSNSQLRRSLDLLREDQEAARSVQTRLLPISPLGNGHYKCQHIIVPSLYLSGDSVDCWEAEDGSLIFYVADVSGHGASSAFVSVLLMYLARDIARRHYRKYGEISAAKLLGKLNKELCRANLQKHATAFLGILDTNTHKLSYASAGHYPMPVVSMDGTHRFLEGSSFPLGVRDSAHYEQQQFEIDKSFTINLFSDGVLELIQADSLDEKEAFLLKMVSDADAEFEALFTAFKLDAVSDAPDDVALMTVSYESLVS